MRLYEPARLRDDWPRDPEELVALRTMLEQAPREAVRLGRSPALPGKPLQGTAHFHFRECRRIEHLVDRARHQAAYPGRTHFGHIALDQSTRIT